MIDGLGVAAEVSVEEVGVGIGENSLNFDSSMAMDFSNDSESSNFATEKLDLSDQSTLSKMDSLDLLKKENPNGFESSHSYEKGNHTFETNDKGNIYKIDGDLIPSNEYTVRGYDYKTDDHGRIISACGDLHWKDHEGRLPLDVDIHQIGKGSERADDDRGHLIADEFNGSNGIENLVPMNSDLNRNGDYRNLEKEWEQALYDKKSVQVEIEPQYSDDSKRPESFIVGYTIDGEYYEKSFSNEARGDV